MNITTAPTTPTRKVAEQSIAKIILRASFTGLSIKFWSASELAGFWTIESDTILTMMKRTNPSTAANSRNMNFLAVRQGWENARTKVTAASKASSMPGGFSSIPTTVEAIADKQQITKRISVLILLLRVEKASIMTISFFGCGFRLWVPNARIKPRREAASA
jgi:hypothetical protein